MAGSGRAARAWGRGAMTAREVLAGVLDVGPWEMAVGALVGMSVLLVAGPRGRSVRGVTARRWGLGAEGGRAVGGAGGGALGRRLRWWPGLPWGARASDAPSVQVVVTQVASTSRGMPTSSEVTSLYRAILRAGRCLQLRLAWGVVWQ